MKSHRADTIITHNNFIEVFMANTYTQINIQLVFAVKGRDCILRSDFRTRLFKYISGIIKEAGHYPLAVNGYNDHVHAFFELAPKQSLSEVARIIKSNSSKWLNENKFISTKFHWQNGYGAFSYSRSQRDNVINYILNQENHHSVKSFREEYLDFLRNYDIDYKDEYLFEWIE
jgi:putative transposase